jgi:hypothetical protein
MLIPRSSVRGGSMTARSGELVAVAITVSSSLPTAVLTNTGLAGMMGAFPDALRDAVYGG